MPEHPSSEIERRLRDTAARRRAAAGEPFRLHPVDRRRLQDEVRAVVGAGGGPARRGFAAWLADHWWKLGTATGTLAILVICVQAFFFPHLSRVPRAASTNATALGTGALQPSVPPTSSPALLDKGPERFADQHAATPALRAAVPDEVATTAKAAQSQAEAAPARQAQPAPESGLRSSVPAVRPTAPTPPPPAALLRMESAENFSGSRSGAGPLRGLDTRAASPALLNAFQVTRQGNAIILTDADGSVYRGVLKAAPAQAPATAPGAAPMAARSAPADSLQRRYGLAPARGSASPVDDGLHVAAEEWDIVLTGTNAVTRQPVQLEGRLQFLDALAGATTNWQATRAAGSAGANHVELSSSKLTNGMAGAVGGGAGTNRAASRALLRGTVQMGNQPPEPIEARLQPR